MNCKFEFLYNHFHEQGGYVSSHKHTCYELVYYIKGRGHTCINGADYKYSENTFSITKPFFLHDERHDEDTSVLFIGFKYDGTDIVLKEGLFIDNMECSVLNLLEVMKHEMLNKEKYYEDKIDLLLKALIIEQERLNINKCQTKDELLKVKRHIGENLNSRIEVKTLADISGYSYHHFRHLFKQKTGFSPIDYITSKRVEKAKYLLSNTTLTISHIAQECGFPNSTQFGTIFKKYMELTPSNYRKQASNGL